MNFFFGAMSMISGIYQSAMMAKAGKQAQQAAAQNAEMERARGEAAAEDELRLGRQVAGSQRVAAASQGVVIDRGTPVDVRAQTLANAKLNALRQMWGAEQGATMEEYRGAQVARAYQTQAIGTLLDTGFNAYNLGLLGNTGDGLPFGAKTFDRYFPGVIS